MAATVVTLTGTYRDAGGDPASGVVTFRPTAPIADTAGDVIAAVPVSVTLDAQGAFSVDLYATDDATSEPTGNSYTVTERIHGAQVRTYRVVLSADDGTAQNLANLAPALTSPAYDYALASDLTTLDTTVSAHTADTTGVHGITDTSRLVVLAPAPSGSDDSATLIALADALASGGTIRLQPGTYVAQGLPIRAGIYWQGAGQGATVIALPASPTDHLFKTTGTTTVDSGGIRDCELDGGGTSTYDAVNCSSLTQLDAFEVVGNYIHDFRAGWRGSSGNDRWPLIAHNRIWGCDIGLSGEEHPIVHHNDFRDCTIGMEGRFNDFYSVGNKFAYCATGVQPKSGQNISNSHFIGCMFYANTTKALEVTGSSRVVGCQFYPANGSPLGVLLSGGLNAVSDCHFGQSGGFTYLENIRLGSTVARNQITNNTFVCVAGPGITDTSTGVCNDVTITGNTFYCTNQPAVVFDTAPLHSSVIANNVVRYVGTSGSTACFVIQSTGGLGNVITGNSFSVEGGATLAYAIRADVRYSIVTGNRCRNFTQANALDSVNSDANTVKANNIGIT